MPCQDCSSNNITYTYTQGSLNPTNNCMTVDSACVYYSGAALVNIESESNVSLESIILKIDSKLGSPNNTDLS